MQAAVGIGIALALVGLAGIGWCLLTASAIRNGELAEDAARRAMRRMNAVNMASVALAFMGLAIVAVGLILS